MKINEHKHLFKESCSVDLAQRPGRRPGGRKGGFITVLARPTVSSFQRWVREEQDGRTKSERPVPEKPGGEGVGREEGKDRRREGKGTSRTQLIKLCVDSRRTRHRTDQSGFEEGGPAVDQTPLPPNVILDGERRRGRSFILPSQSDL